MPLGSAATCGGTYATPQQAAGAGCWALMPVTAAPDMLAKLQSVQSTKQAQDALEGFVR
jgi:hypothetical protein